MHLPVHGLLLAALVIALSACEVEVSEIDRIAAPDGKLDLVVTTADGGATTSVTYYANLVPPGEKADLDDAVFVAEKAWSFSASWISAEKVLISCGDARVFSYRNFWQSREVDNFEHVVRIGLEGCAD